MKGACNHPVVVVQYRDDLTGALVTRLRCERCAITYQTAGPSRAGKGLKGAFREKT